MSWKSWDMAKRKRMVKQAFQDAKIDFDKVLRTVASWNESSAIMRDRAMITKLFGKKAEGGAGFRKPK